MKYSIEKMKSSHWEEVKNIYLAGVKAGNATFETKAPSWEEWDNSHLKICRLVACSVDGILGWVALSPTSSRDCFKGVVEVSIYIDEKYNGQGIGTALLTKLIEQSEENEIWTLYSCIMRENYASIAMHKKCGFREIGIREKIAKMSNGVWRDVVLMDRRSKVVGIN